MRAPSVRSIIGCDDNPDHKLVDLVVGWQVDHSETIILADLPIQPKYLKDFVVEESSFVHGSIRDVQEDKDGNKTGFAKWSLKTAKNDTYIKERPFRLESSAEPAAVIWPKYKANDWKFYYMKFNVSTEDDMRTKLNYRVCDMTGKELHTQLTHNSMVELHGVPAFIEIIFDKQQRGLFKIPLEEKREATGRCELAFDFGTSNSCALMKKDPKGTSRIELTNMTEVVFNFGREGAGRLCDPPTFLPTFNGNNSLRSALMPTELVFDVQGSIDSEKEGGKVVHPEDLGRGFNKFFTVPNRYMEVKRSFTQENLILSNFKWKNNARPEHLAGNEVDMQKVFIKQFFALILAEIRFNDHYSCGKIDKIVCTYPLAFEIGRKFQFKNLQSSIRAVFGSGDDATSLPDLTGITISPNIEFVHESWAAFRSSASVGNGSTAVVVMDMGGGSMDVAAFVPTGDGINCYEDAPFIFDSFNYAGHHLLEFIASVTQQQWKFIGNLIKKEFISEIESTLSKDPSEASAIKELRKEVCKKIPDLYNHSSRHDVLRKFFRENHLDNVIEENIAKTRAELFFKGIFEYIRRMGNMFADFEESKSDGKYSIKRIAVVLIGNGWKLSPLAGYDNLTPVLDSYMEKYFKHKIQMEFFTDSLYGDSDFTGKERIALGAADSIGAPPSIQPNVLAGCKIKIRRSGDAVDELGNEAYEYYEESQLIPPFKREGGGVKIVVESLNLPQHMLDTLNLKTENNLIDLMNEHYNTVVAKSATSEMDDTVLIKSPFAFFLEKVWMEKIRNTGN